MSYSDEQIKAMFAKIDANKDGFVSKEELIALMQTMSISHEPDQVSKFFSAADANHDNKISLDEFTHYIHFKTSNLKDIDTLLEMTASSVAALKKLDAMAHLNLNDEHFSDLKIHDATVASDNALGSRFKLLFSTGKEIKNEQLLALLNFPLDQAYFLAFKFHVADKAKLLAGLPGLWTRAKEFLSELGPESQEFLGKTDTDFLETPDGVLMAFKAKPDCFISHYIKMMEASSAGLQELNCSLGFTLGTDLDLSHLRELTFEDALSSNLYFDLFSKTINLANLINVPQIRKQLEQSNLERDFPALSTFFAMLSLTNAKLDIELDKNLKRKLIGESGLKQLKEKAFVASLDKSKALWAENPTRELIESMDFLKEEILLLHEAQLDQLSLFIQCKGFMMGLNVKGSFFNLIQEFIPLK